MLTADVHDERAYRAAVDGRQFDAVVNFVAFTPQDVERDIRVLAGKARQYVLISTASVYQNPPRRLPLTESTPLGNPLWDYGQQKIACEEVLRAAYRDQGFPALVVRPSHTYDRADIPFEGGWTVIDRMRRGKEVIVHGDGTSLWPLTHSSDFAVGLVGLLGTPNLEGESFHIVSEETLTWNRIYETVAEAAGVEPRLVHVPSDAIAVLDSSELKGHASFWGTILTGGKSHSLLFDTSKIKSVVPEFGMRSTWFAEGAREMIEWHDADATRRTIDDRYNDLADRVIEHYRPRSL